MKMERLVIFPEFPHWYPRGKQKTEKQSNKTLERVLLTSSVRGRKVYYVIHYLSMTSGPPGVDGKSNKFSKKVTSVHSVQFPPAHTEETRLSALCCIGFSWSKAIFLKSKRRFSVACCCWVFQIRHGRDKGAPQTPQTNITFGLRSQVLTLSPFQTFTDKLQSLCPVLCFHINSTSSYISLSKRKKHSRTSLDLDLCKNKAVDFTPTAISYLQFSVRSSDDDLNALKHLKHQIYLVMLRAGLQNFTDFHVQQLNSVFQWSYGNLWKLSALVLH